MKRYVLKMAVLLLVFAISACQKDDEDYGKAKSESTASTEVDVKNDDALVYDGKPMKWEMSKPISLSKGKRMDSYLAFDIYNYLTGKEVDTSSCVYNDDPSVRYKTLKVYRRNNPGRYFYVMIENLDLNWSSGCYAYKNNNNYVPTYGRLYTWGAANTIASKFKMELKVYNNNGSRVLIEPFTSVGRLPTLEDILDIMEADSIAHLPEYGKGLDVYNDEWDGFTALYYDAFVFGVEDAQMDASKANHSLAGGKSCTYGVPDLDLYTSINKLGTYWTSSTEIGDSDAHYLLSVCKQDNYRTYDYVAYVNVMLRNLCGSSVRYVFEPKYLNIQ